ncbi:MAG: hypothetical protein IPN62_06295 [Flavobacteriales bacterium]|nr:hypothetical protein [Flavobacteriales bacterium]
MGIERDLAELLHDHDCVIVPQWGGFLTHYRPARLDEARHLIHPPAKELGFNRHLVRNDGLLADHLAKRDRIDFGQANQRIEQQIALWAGVLEREGRLELPHMGIFFRDEEGNLQFDPDRRINFLRDAYGLRPIKALLAKEEVKVRPVPVIQMPNPSIEPEPEAQRYTARWVAAAFALVLSGAAVYWVIQQGEAGHTRWSDVSPFRSTELPATIALLKNFRTPLLALRSSPFRSEEVTTVPMTRATASPSRSICALRCRTLRHLSTARQWPCRPWIPGCGPVSISSVDALPSLRTRTSAWGSFNRPAIPQCD